MGLRGPGAVAIRRKTAAKPKRKTRPPWQKPGLSRVERVIAFLQSLPVTSGPLAGTTFRVRPWQRKTLEAIYATDHLDRRPIRTAIVSMGRKNGKTTLAAGLTACHLCGPEAESRGECYTLANDRFQASRVFNELSAVITRSPELSGRISIRRHSKEMEVISGEGEGSLYAALSADVGAKDGLSPSFAVYDELGAAPNRALFDLIDTAMGGRDEPLLLAVSTQAADDLAPLSGLIDYGERVQSGAVEDPAFHLTLFTAPPEADPWALATWRMANPSLGDFRSLEDVERQALQAQRMPAKAAAFRNKILNQRVAAESRFLSLEEWRACGDPVRSDEELEGQQCFAGLDLGATRDLTALVSVFPSEDGRLDVKAWFFLPADGLEERESRDRVPYREWADRGLLTLMPGSTSDPAFVAQLLAELRDRYVIEGLAYDRWRIEPFKRALTDVGVEDFPLIAHGQGYRDFSPALDALERAVAEKQLRHGGHPILMWNAANAVATRDPTGAQKLDKSRSTGRIDGLVALTMALGLRSRAPQVEEVSELSVTWL